MCELLDVQDGFRKGRGTRDQMASICWIIKKVREFQKNLYFCFIDYDKAFDCLDHGMAHSFIELDKAVVHVIIVVFSLSAL